MKKLLILALIVMLAMAFSSPAFSIMKGERIFETKMGDITFSADKHKAAGKKCSDCHDKIFEKKQGDVTVKMPKAHQEGQGCGVCHDATNRSKCSFCHKK